MKLLETYKHKSDADCFLFNYNCLGYDGWLHKKDLQLSKKFYTFKERDCVYRITQTQGNSVA
ncbi:hypothetical protein AVV30_gp010 [Vibrio phage phi 1]|uniref:Uncharacterized protein n=1 Tax=Vibrio phage phi 1 TaxID=1589297 RepID=A0A0B5H8H6_9CAUD|nr:hypothetical protein AVV30_gp010 [Vibrio phage phi 1]AJF40668.1 hypothetical protein SBVP1_0010 [Vibrio phage phi 1]